MSFPHRRMRALPGRARVLIRLAAVAVLSGALLLAGAGVAAAHVTVDPPTAAAGSYATLTFKVPTESAKASTVSVQVTLPRDHPLPSVSAEQIPGWTATVTTTPLDPPVTEGTFRLTEAVTAVTWTADDHIGIKPGQFARFALSVGPIPEVATLRFSAVQTYSDGSVVRWDQVPAGGDEPEHPAPSLTVTPPGSAAGASAGSPGGSDSTARVLAVVALVLAAAALLVAVFGLRRRPGLQAAGTGPAGTVPAGSGVDTDRTATPGGAASPPEATA